MSRFDAVFFDLGGTLFSYRTCARSLAGVIAEAAARLGADTPRRELGRAYNTASHRVAARYASEPYYLHRDMFLDTYREFARELAGEPGDEAFLEWFYAAQRDAVVKHFELREDCHSTLAQLREAGLDLSIVSNIDNDYLEPMVERVGLADRVDRWMSSETARSCKPDARFFRLCLDEAGHTPERVLFVGDSPLHDIVGARSLGMQTALIQETGFDPPGQKGSEAEPHFRIRSLADLLPIVSDA